MQNKIGENCPRGIKVVTIGVYGFSENEFFNRLQSAKIDIFCDIRMRRGMRGPLYSFANSKALQKKLSEIGIKYIHFKDLAPSKNIREKQKRADFELGVRKNIRQVLSPEFIISYKQECLNDQNMVKFLNSLGEKTKTIALFCVEGEPLACHRSLLAEKLHNEMGYTVEDIRS